MVICTTVGRVDQTLQHKVRQAADGPRDRRGSAMYTALGMVHLLSLAAEMPHLRGLMVRNSYARVIERTLPLDQRESVKTVRLGVFGVQRAQAQ